MPKKRFSAEQIVTVLTSGRGADVARQGSTGCLSRGGNLAAELRDECLNGELFYSLKEATVVIEQWRNHYNTIRPHSSLDYRPPAPRTSSPTMLHLDRSTAMQ